MRPDRLVEDHAQRRGRREEGTGQVGGDGVSGVGRQIDEAAFGDDQGGQGRVDVWETGCRGRVIGGGSGRVERAQVDGMDVVGWRVQAGEGGEGERFGDEGGEERGAGDGGDFRAGEGGEVELVVNEGLDGELGREPEEARVGAGAERQDLFPDRGEGVEESGDEMINGASTDIRSYIISLDFPQEGNGLSD